MTSSDVQTTVFNAFQPQISKTNLELLKFGPIYKSNIAIVPITIRPASKYSHGHPFSVLLQFEVNLHSNSTPGYSALGSASRAGQ